MQTEVNFFCCQLPPILFCSVMRQYADCDIISILGRVNAGKSSLINLLSGQKDFAIVDETPGTTADTVVARMQIHGLGPVKLLDTAGIDESGALGEKKRRKSFLALEESDLCLIVIDPQHASDTDDFALERQLINHAREWRKQTAIIFNARKPSDILPDFGLPAMGLNALDQTCQPRLIEFLLTHYHRPARNIALFPDLPTGGTALLVIPMDEETPELKLLRPQTIAVERLLRNYTTPILYRPDLQKGRSPEKSVAEAEKKRYQDILRHLANGPNPLRFVLTDSQALDLIGPWTPPEAALTTFSVMMANFLSSGKLDYLYTSTEAVKKLTNTSRVLIAEACNHDRKCDDIGTLQIPRFLKQNGRDEITIDFSFGWVYPDDVSVYDLVVHCGACYIDRQKYLRRLRLAQLQQVPFTNYGLLLAAMQNEALLKRVVMPFVRR